LHDSIQPTLAYINNNPEAAHVFDLTGDAAGGGAEDPLAVE